MSVNDYDADLFESIEELVGEGELEAGTAAHGIAQKVITDGYDSLTAEQQRVYDKFVVPALVRLGERVRVTQLLNSAAP